MLVAMLLSPATMRISIFITCLMRQEREILPQKSHFQESTRISHIAAGRLALGSHASRAVVVPVTTKEAVTAAFPCSLASRRRVAREEKGRREQVERPASITTGRERCRSGRWRWRQSRRRMIRPSWVVEVAVVEEAADPAVGVVEATADQARRWRPRGGANEAERVLAGSAAAMVMSRPTLLLVAAPPPGGRRGGHQGVLGGPHRRHCFGVLRGGREERGRRRGSWEQ
jgi:hypothetical protein